MWDKRRSLILLIAVVALLSSLAGGLITAQVAGIKTMADDKVRTVPIVSSVGDIIPQINKRVGPAVVNITTKTLTYDFFFQATPREGAGTGFIIDKKGYILTNNHVVNNAQSVLVTLSNGKKLKAKLIGSDPDNDLAVLKIDQSTELPVAALGDSSKVQVGELAVAIGNPFGLGQTVTAGVISALNRSISEDSSNVLNNLLQTDASINPGNSGGPLVNSRGEVIGINTAIISQAQGIGFAIPINTGKDIAQQLIDKGRVVKPWLGILGTSITEEIAQQYSLPLKAGTLVVQVMPDSPAEAGGLKEGDIIEDVDGQSVVGMPELQQEIKHRKPGDVLKMTVYRQEKKLKLEIRLGEAGR